MEEEIYLVQLVVVLIKAYLGHLNQLEVNLDYLDRLEQEIIHLDQILKDYLAHSDLSILKLRNRHRQAKIKKYLCRP